MRDIETQKHFIKIYKNRLAGITERHSNITGQNDFIDGFCLGRPNGLFWDTYQGKDREKIISKKYNCLIGRKGHERVVDFQLYFWSGVSTILLTNLQPFETQPKLGVDEIAPHLDGKCISDDATDMDISFLPAESYYKALYEIMKQWLTSGQRPLENDRKDRVFLALYEELGKMIEEEKLYDENPLSVIESICWAKEYQLRGTR